MTTVKIMMREKRLNALMIETITEIKNTMRKTIQVKQHISRAPQWMKIKERILERVAVMLIYINYMFPLFLVTHIMIFMIMRKNLLQKIQFFG